MNTFWERFFHGGGAPIWCVVSAAATCFFGFILVGAVGHFFSSLTWLLPSHEIGFGPIASILLALDLVPIVLISSFACGLFAFFTNGFWKAWRNVAS
jgi:hypothetical protein